MSTIELQNWLTVRRVGMILVILAIIVIIFGQLIQRQTFDIKDLYISLWANLGTELFSIAITILIVDRLYQRHDEEREKKQLMLQMSSPDSSFSQEAIRSLRARGWLTDGSLHRANLRWANLERGELWRADLQMADFHRANLNGARLAKANLLGALNLDDMQLINARNLAWAIMPDGNLYDGRLNLEGDFYLAKGECVNIDDSNEMAKFYNITLEEYQNGQEWARENLAILKKKRTEETISSNHNAA